MQELQCETAVLMGPNIYTEMALDQYAEATVGYAGEAQGHAHSLTLLFASGSKYKSALEELFNTKATNYLAAANYLAAVATLTR